MMNHSRPSLALRLAQKLTGAMAMTLTLILIWTGPALARTSQPPGLEALKWGEIYPDFIQLFQNISKIAPAQARLLASGLKSECANLPAASTHPIVRAKAKVCRFPERLDHLMIAQEKVATLMTQNVIVTEGDGGELNLRAINWEIDPFNEVIGADGKSVDPIPVLVQWLIARKELSASIEDVSAYLSLLPLSLGASAQIVELPALKAYYSSPLLIGQISYFINQQKCLPQQTLCKEVNQELRKWLLEQVQELRPNLTRLKSFFDERASQLPLPEAERLKELYHADSTFQIDSQGMASNYTAFLSHVTMATALPPADIRKAQFGTIIVSEVLRAFGGDISEQAPLSVSIMHPQLGRLEEQMRSEIEGPIFDLEGTVYNLEEGEL